MDGRDCSPGVSPGTTGRAMERIGGFEPPEREAQGCLSTNPRHPVMTSQGKKQHRRECIAPRWRRAFGELASRQPSSNQLSGAQTLSNASSNYGLSWQQLLPGGGNYAVFFQSLRATTNNTQPSHQESRRPRPLATRDRDDGPARGDVVSNRRGSGDPDRCRETARAPGRPGAATTTFVSPETRRVRSWISSVPSP
jgi:hypothetical protein